MAGGLTRSGPAAHHTVVGHEALAAVPRSAVSARATAAASEHGRAADVDDGEATPGARRAPAREPGGFGADARPRPS